MIRIVTIFFLAVLAASAGGLSAEAALQPSRAFAAPGTISEVLPPPTGDIPLCC